MLSLMSWVFIPAITTTGLSSVFHCSVSKMFIHKILMQFPTLIEIQYFYNKLICNLCTNKKVTFLLSFAN